MLGGKQLSVMNVLTILLGHELDGQIDEVLRLAEAYDNDGSAFRLRYLVDVGYVVLSVVGLDVVF